MPGMMDTILNLGLNDEAVEGLARRTGNPRFAYDSYRRLIQMFGEVVDGIDGAPLRGRADRAEARRAAPRPTPTSPPTTWRELVETFKGIYRDEQGGDFPPDATDAAAARGAGRVRLLGHAAGAGLPPRERDPRRPRHRRQRRPDGLRQQGRPLGHRRRVHAQPGDRRARALRRVPRQRPGRGRRRRDPHAPAGRVDGARSCRRPTSSCSRRCAGSRSTTATCRTSSSRSRTASLYLLQTRSAKRTAAAALKAAVDMVDEGLIIARGGGRCASTRRSSTSSCTRGSTPTAAPEPVAQGPEREPGRGERRDRLRRRHARSSGPRAARSSSSATRRRRTTSTG